MSKKTLALEQAERKMLALSDIKANQQNPRSISESRLKKLVNSILVFPRMLELRPIVIQEDNIVLGGNMRLTALNRIAQMSEDEIVAQLENLPEYNELPDGGAAVRAYWGEFLKKKQTPVVLAAELSETEKEQFIIKDNVSFGEWDYDELENWDKAKLEGWGVDTLMPDFGAPETGGGNLPPELNGVELQPEGLEKLEGDDETAMKRVIICYEEKDEETLAGMLGLENIEKVVYKFEELVK